MLKPEYAPLAPDRRALIIKEIMPAQAEHYRKISSVWSPYLETVYGVLPVGDFFIALNEFIPKPSSLYYPDRKLLKNTPSLWKITSVTLAACQSRRL